MRRPWMRQSVLRASLVFVALVFVVAGSGCASAPTIPSTSVPTGAVDAAKGAAATAGGEALVQTKCSMCHNLDRVNAASKDAAGWSATIDKMVGNGAVLTGEEKAAIIDYLTKRDSK
jgi:cytochrome c5